MEAIDRYGVLHGGAMAAWRLLRCHPFAKSGHDPVVKNEMCCEGIAASTVRCETMPNHDAPTTNDRRLRTSC